MFFGFSFRLACIYTDRADGGDGPSGRSSPSLSLFHFSPHSSAAALFSSLFYIMSNVSGLAASIRAATDSETFDLAGHDVS